MIKILRVLAMGLTTGLALLFVFRDVLRAEPSVYFVAAGIGVLIGFGLEIANARLTAANERATPRG